MMNTLLESRPRKPRSTGGALFSVIFHSAIVLFAVFATARASVTKDGKAYEQTVKFFKAAPAREPVKTKSDTPPRTAAVAPPKAFRFEAPITIPTRIPEIDLSAKATNPDDFKDNGKVGGSFTGVEGSTGAGVGLDTRRDYFEFEVERQVTAISGTNMKYPELMRAAGIEGEVMAQFVVDENGRVEMSTFKVLSSTNAMFTQSVRDALSGMRFRPAQIGRTNVSQVVQQAFVFKLNK
jgi:protein TonB